ncbi:MAG TPA: hypothetical protein PLZ36_01560 [Armatimonadota bacterium]|nr:hypothetical protein [Armatimonadota bacterium]
MLAMLLLPAALSALALAAHFLRDGQLFFVLCALALIPLLFVRRAWAGRVVQGAMAIGAVIWAQVAWGIAQQRLALGEPYLRMAVILGGVAAVALLAAVLIQTRRARRHFRLQSADVL